MRTLVFFVFMASAAHAQADWETLAPATGLTTAPDGFGPDWSSGPGIVVRVETPAYGGLARAEVLGALYEATDETLPEFAVIMPTLGWGPAAHLGRVRLSAGGRLGIAQFRFDRDDVGNFKNETEVAIGGWAGGAVRLAGPVEAWAEANVTRLVLADPRVIATLSAGLALRLDSPSWLQGVFR